MDEPSLILFLFICFMILVVYVAMSIQEDIWNGTFDERRFFRAVKKSNKGNYVPMLKHMSKGSSHTFSDSDVDNASEKERESFLEYLYLHHTYRCFAKNEASVVRLVKFFEGYFDPFFKHKVNLPKKMILEIRALSEEERKVLVRACKDQNYLAEQLVREDV